MKKMLTIVAALGLMSASVYGIDTIIDRMPDIMRTPEGVFNSQYNKTYVAEYKESLRNRSARYGTTTGLTDDEVKYSRDRFISCVVTSGYDHPKCYRPVASVEAEKTLITQLDERNILDNNPKEFMAIRERRFREWQNIAQNALAVHREKEAVLHAAIAVKR